jgi:hypothetical protein
MTGQPTFDAERSARIKRMLMRAVEDNVAPAPTKRVALLVSLVLGAVLLASGGAAWALSGKPLFFQAPAPAPTVVSPKVGPTSTPTATPSPSPTATPAAEDPGRPHSTLPIGCDSLSDLASVGSIVAGAAPYVSDTSGGIYTPTNAGLAQSGVLTCAWYSTAPIGYVSVSVATDPSSGQKDVSAQLGHGASRLAVGDGGALTCPPGGQCLTSVTSGAYWFTVAASADGLDRSRDIATRASTAFAKVLANYPQPRAAWVPPASSWSPGGDCAALKTDRPITDVLGAKWLTGPYPFAVGTADPIAITESRAFNCYFESAPGIQQDPAIITHLTVQVAPGATWAYAQANDGGLPVSVRGAQDASFVCSTAEGEYCHLNVLTDNAWMQLGFGDVLPPERKDKLIAAAEALIAGHRG